MRIRLLFLLPAIGVCAFGQSYSYDYTGIPAAGSTWTANGAVDSDLPPAINFSPDAGSFIYQPTVTGANANDYEVSIAMQPGDSKVIEYLRASSSAMTSPYGATGSYISVEEAGASLVINQSVSGVVTQLGSATIASFPSPLTLGPVTLRSVVWSSTLWVFFNNQLVYTNTALPTTSGQPGIGGYGNGTVAAYIQSVRIGHHDVTAPAAPNPIGIRSSILPNSVSLAWQGVVDDSTGNGVGLYRYNVSRNGGAATYIVGSPLMTDNTTAPGTSYTYTISAEDFHGNTSAATTYSVTAPAANAVDPRRVGIFTTGSYWGGGGEQIDTLSGNLNFSFPLVKPQGRTGWTVPIALSYNSQNWRSDGGANWELGTDTGFGFGWSMQIGSITPYYAEWSSGVDHYVYTDGTGAAYRLDQNNGNVWSSLAGIYVWFDANTNKLHFKDGTFWVMGCTSSGGEQDAGTMYPTVIEDVNGNQVLVTYQAAVAFPSGLVNTSARITGIEDVRRAVNTLLRSLAYQTYAFTYNTDPIPHLTAVANWIGTPESFPTFSYATSVPLAPPFNPTDPAYAGATTTHLTNIAVPAAGPTGSSVPAAGQYTFAYDSSGAGELAQVTFPWGGHLRWTYGSATYAGTRLLREVSNRYLAADYAGSVEWGPYPFTHSDSGGTIATVHADTTLGDASGVGAKKWTFNTSSGAGAWEIGLTSQFEQLTAAGGTDLTTDAYVWSQSGGSTTFPVIGANPYISQKTHTVAGTVSPSESAQTNQTTDAYGNITDVKVYSFNVTSGTPLREYQNTYLNSSAYTSQYILNRSTATSLIVGGVTKNLVQNLYDSAGYNGQPTSNPCTGTLPVTGPVSHAEFDYLTPVANSRGLLTQTTNPVTQTTNSPGWGCMQYDGYGNGSGSTVWNGSTTTASADPSTNYAAPTTVTTESYNYSLAYNTWLGVGQTVGANGEQMTMSYDSYGRPAGATSAFTAGGHGAVGYAYPTAAVLPTWQMKVAEDGYTYTILDGLGRPTQIKRGDATGPQSYTSSVYAPCACSPLGKLQKTSQPYATSSSVAWTQQITGDPLAWTSYTYDGIGRTLTVTQPDGVSVTTYSYSGNQTTVTDPAGNWKTFTTDVLGNLITVTEPDPANLPSGTVTISYAYDWMNHLTTSTMTRGLVTQTRTFVYNDAGQLTSATNPESGTVTYTYNPTGTLGTKVDANGHTTGYGYDAQNRLTGAGNWSDPCTGVSYIYGTDTSLHNYGRLVSTTYGTTSQVCVPGTTPTSYEEQYTYNQAGAVASKAMSMSRVWTDWNNDTWTLNGAGSWWENMNVYYNYDYWGNVAEKKYSGSDPFNSSPSNPPTVDLRYTRDSMGRLTGMTDGASGPVWVQGVSYDLANRMTQLQYPQYASVFDYITEAKSYNVNGQLASMTWTPGVAGQGAPSGAISYSYTGTGHTGNNGQIVQAVDGVSGETIVYQYDVLKRLTSGSSSPTSGTTPAAWTQAYTYDGFGNLTGKTLGGTTTAIPVNAGTNQLMDVTGVLSNVSYDANGNLLSAGSGPTMAYDGFNRIVSATVGSGTEYYGYDPSNRRMYKRASNGTEEWTFYGAQGEKLATFAWVLTCDDWTDPTTCYYAPTVQTTNVWFGGKLIWSGTGAANTSGPAFTDKLGTNRANGARFYPYGDEITSTANGYVKFATYNRDSFTALDYADQRYYASAYGRFTSVDPARANPRRPGSWNRYTYASDDPVNRNDPTGRIDCESWYQWLEIYGGGAIPDSSTLGNCADGEADSSEVSFDPCSVSADTLTALDVPLSCAAPQCYDAGSSGSCSSGGAAGGTDPALATPGGGGNPNAPQVTNQYQAAGALAYELANLSPNCDKVLPVGLLNQKASNLSFWDVRINGTVPLSAIGAANIKLSNGKFATTIGTAWIYPTAAAETLSAIGGGFSSNIVLGSYFFDNESPGAQGLTLLHELLHYTTQLGDVAFDQAYGISGASGQSASAALTSWLTNDCNN